MARPRLAVPFDDIIDAYQRTGSVRGASELLTISRWAVERRLEEAGIPILDRDAALAQVRLLRDSDPRPRRVEERITHLGQGLIGCTVVRIRRSIPFSPCVWPDCCREAQGAGAICEEHADVVAAAEGWRCPWPGCHQELVAADLCYAHEKLAQGLSVASA